MRRIFAALFALAAVAAEAAPFDIPHQQWGPTGLLLQNRLPPTPTLLPGGVFFFNAQTRRAEWATLGSGLSYSGGVLSASGNSFSGSYNDLTNKPSLFSGSYADLSGVPVTFAPAAHTHSAADITSGTIAEARLPSLSISKTAGLQSALDAKYDASNPAGFVSQAGARSSITLTTNGTSGAATFNASTGILNVPNYTVSGSSGGTVTSVTAGAGLSGGTITGAGTISLPNVGTPGTYANVTTDAQGRVVSGTTRAITYVTRTLNTCFQVSAARDADVLYNVEIQASAAIVGGQQGTVYLETFTDSACTTGAQEVMRQTNGNTSALLVAVGNVSTTTLTVQGPIPAGMYARVRTQNNTGTPTFTARPGWERLP